MKARTLINALVIGSICLILYLFVGHNYVKFYFGGKAEILGVAARVNKLCNDNGSCPATLEGWKTLGGRSETLVKNDMLYFVASGERSKEGGKRKDREAFRLVYRFFEPDHWFEVQGGVGMAITSGWKSR